MPDFDFTSPEGKKYTVSGPQDATKEQAFSILQSQIKAGTAKQTDSGAKDIPGAQKTPGSIPSAPLAGAGPGGKDLPMWSQPKAPEQKPTGLGNAILTQGGRYDPDTAKKMLTGDVETALQAAPGLGAMSPKAAQMISGVGGQTAKGIIGRSALGGAIQSATEATQDQGGDYAKVKAQQIATGGAFGGLIGGAGHVIGTAVKPWIDNMQDAEKYMVKGGEDARKMLINAGVRLTPGQMTGGLGKDAEENLASVPGIKQMILGAQDKAIRSFNLSAINQALGPIGKQLPKGSRAGGDSIEFAQKAISDGYNKVLGQVHLDTANKDFLTGIAELKEKSGVLTDQMKDKFDKEIKDKITSRVLSSDKGRIDGRAYKRMEEDFSKLARNYSGPNASGSERELGEMFQGVRDHLTESLINSNPEHAEELGKLGKAYARLSIVEKAANQRANSGGVFSVNDYAQAIKSNALKYEGRKTLAAGNAEMQQFANAASKVLPTRTPNSGTVDRAMWAAILGGGGGALLHNPLLAAGAIGSVAPYTNLGMNAMRMGAVAAPQARNAIGSGIQQMSPFAIGPANTLLGGQ